MVVWLPSASPYSAPGVWVMTLYSLTPSTPIVVPTIDELLIPKKPIIFAPSSMYEFEWMDRTTPCPNGEAGGVFAERLGFNPFSNGGPTDFTSEFGFTGTAIDTWVPGPNGAG